MAATITVPSHMSGGDNLKPQQAEAQGEVTQTVFGPHLMLDCRGCDIERIGNVQHIYQVLYDLPEFLGMTRIIQPYVFPYSGLVPEDAGVTGMVIIAESHLTFHSFTEKDYFFFDIFSCKPFPTQKVIDYVVKAFGVKEYESHEASRGRNFPRVLTPETKGDYILQP